MKSSDEKSVALLQMTEDVIQREWQKRLLLIKSICSKAEWQAAEYLLSKKEGWMHMTLRQVADGAEVGQPTVVRMLKKAGYTSWNVFVRELCKPLENESEVVDRNLPAGLRSVQSNIHVICKMAAELDTRQLKKLAGIMKKAHLIDIYGTDNSAGAASELSGKLLHMGLPSRNYQDLFYQKVGAGHLEAKDVAIGFSMSGETKAVVDALIAAKMSHAVTVAVTADTQSTLTRYADYIFYTPTEIQSEASRWISSRIAQTVFVDAICMTLLESDTGYFSRNLQASTDEFKEDVIQVCSK